MEPLESIYVLGRDRRTQVSPHSCGWCWKAQCGPKLHTSSFSMPSSVSVGLTCQ